MNNNGIGILFRILLWMVLTIPVAWAEWIKMTNCVLVPHPANDGDSFVIRHQQQEHLVRLYFVDAPETNLRFPERVEEQAALFGATVERTVQAGHAATAYVEKALQKPFTVYTQNIDAQGSGRQPRVFAMVRLGDDYLCERLVARGYARVFGYRRDLPDGTFWQDYERHLQTIQEQARLDGVGLWERPRKER